MLNFPSAPSLSQVFTAAGRSWVWDSVKWVAYPPPAVTGIIVVNTTTTLATGFTGFVRVENTTGIPITVTLPASPTPNQVVTLKDSAGNSSDDAITISGNGNSIDGVATLLLNYNYSFAELTYTGVQWVQA
jgi:chitinase